MTCAHAEELSPAFETRWSGTHQPHMSLVNQGSGLQRMAWPLLRHVAARHLP
jgi:hypothetical protein